MFIKTTWKKALSLMILVVLLGLSIIVFISFRVTERPDFCLSCHYMKPYYKTWQESAHHQVNCLKCHYELGIRGHITGKFKASAQLVKYVTRTYGTKPWAEISDENCLQEGCHRKEKLFEQNIIFKNRVLFNHQQHLGKLKRGHQLRCTSCHSQIVKGEHFSVHETVCFICHFKEVPEEKIITRCGDCHGPPEGQITHDGRRIEHAQFLKHNVKCETCHVHVTRGKGEVAQQRCLSCHNQIGEEFNDPKFLHNVHVTRRKVECFECHEEIKHGLTKVAKLLHPDCGSCHTGAHSPQRQMYMGTGGLGVPESPSPMFAAHVYCTGCHLSDEKVSSLVTTGRLFRAKKEACVKCHGEGYDQILLSWQSILEEMIGRVTTLKDGVKQQLEQMKGMGMNDEVMIRARKLYKEAEYNLIFVQLGKGEHNLEYADSLLSRAEKNLKECLNLLKDDGK